MDLPAPPDHLSEAIQAYDKALRRAEIHNTVGTASRLTSGQSITNSIPVTHCSNQPQLDLNEVGYIKIT